MFIFNFHILRFIILYIFRQPLLCSAIWLLPRQQKGRHLCAALAGLSAITQPKLPRYGVYSENHPF